MFCYNCGTEIDASENFCSNCGALIISAKSENSLQTPLDTSIPKPQLIPKKSNQKSKKLRHLKISPKTWIIAGVSVVLIIALVLIISLNPSPQKGAMDAFERYIDAQQNLDADAMIALTPPEYYEYRMNLLIEKGKSPSEAKESNDSYFGKFQLLLFSNNWFVDWLTPGYTVHTDYNIAASYLANKHEISELNSYVKNKFGFKENITNVKPIIFGLTFTSVNHEEKQSYNYCNAILVEINNKWYFVSDASWWESRRGLDYIDKVDWIVEWFRTADVH